MARCVKVFLRGGGAQKNGLRGDLAQLIKASFIICLCVTPLTHSLFHHRQAEKMRRQKQYANAIREQNKNINRIPFIPAKEPKDNDQRVPRIKVCVCVCVPTVLLTSAFVNADTGDLLDSI